MPAKNPRVMVTLDPPLHKWVTRFARADGISVSLKVRDLLKESYELNEDIYLGTLARERERTFNRRKALTTLQARKRLGLDQPQSRSPANRRGG